MGILLSCPRWRGIVGFLFRPRIEYGASSQRRPLMCAFSNICPKTWANWTFFSEKFLKLSIFVKNTQKAPPDFGCSKTRRAVFSDDLSCRHSGICGVRFGISAVRIPRHEGKAEVIFLSRRYADGICSIVAKRMRC